MRERLCDLRKDLEDAEFDGYVSILESKINKFLANPCSGVFEYFRADFVPKVKLPTSLFLDTGLLKYLSNFIMTVEDEKELSQAFLLLSKMIYLTDDLTQSLGIDLITKTVQYITGENRTHVMILLNNILSERKDLTHALIPMFRPYLLDFQNIGVDEVSLSLLSRFARPLYECDQDAFICYAQNALALINLELTEGESVLAMNLLRKCTKIDARVLDLIITSGAFESSILQSIMSPNLSIVESGLTILVSALETGKVTNLPSFESYTMNVLGLDIDVGSIKALSITALRFTSDPSSKLILEVLRGAAECGWDVKTEAVRFVAAKLERQLPSMSDDETVEVVDFLCETCLFSADLSRLALMCLSTIKAFLISIGANRYRTVMARANVEEFVLHCFEFLDDIDVTEMAENLSRIDSTS